MNDPRILSVDTLLSSGVSLFCDGNKVTLHFRFFFDGVSCAAVNVMVTLYN